MIILAERDLESLKIELALNSDFNIIDAFKIFDIKNLGCITSRDFVEGLKSNLDYPDFVPDDIYMFFKRVDS